MQDGAKKKWPRISRQGVICLLIMTGLYVLGISTLLRAHVWYKDDIGRVVEGYLRWEQSSRYISNFLASLINAGTSLTDQAPLQQIIAAFFMAASSMILVRTLGISRKKCRKEDNAPAGPASGVNSIEDSSEDSAEDSAEENISTEKDWNLHGAIVLISALALGLNPYFLECFSFQFDSSFMALSVLAGVCPFVIGVHRRKLFLLTALISTLIVLMTYQASSGIFPMLVLFHALVLWMDRRMQGREALVFVGQSAAAYLVGVVLFRFVFMHNSEGYNSGGMIPLARLFPGLAANYKKVVSWILSDFTPVWLVLFGAVLVLFFVTVVWTTQRSRAATLVAALAVCAMSFLLSNGILIMLESLPAPRRSSYGIFVALTCMMVCIADRDRIWLGRVACIAVVWVFVAFSFTYGNALSENDRVIDSRLSLVAQELDNLDVMQTDTPKYVRLTGTIGRSETLERLKGIYPVLGRMLPSRRAGYMWNIYRFIHCYGLENLYCDDVFVPDFDEEAFLAQTADLPVLAETANYSISGDGEKIVVRMRK